MFFSVSNQEIDWKDCLKTYLCLLYGIYNFNSKAVVTTWAIKILLYFELISVKRDRTRKLASIDDQSPTTMFRTATLTLSLNFNTMRAMVMTIHMPKVKVEGHWIQNG